jgi:hypothetical protein
MLSQDQRTAIYLADCCQPIVKPRNYTEVAAATTDCPEQIRLMLMINNAHSTVSGHYLGGGDIVDGHPIQTTQEANTSTQGETADANAAGVAEANREPVRRERPGDLSGRETGVYPGSPIRNVDIDVVERAEVK